MLNQEENRLDNQLKEVSKNVDLKKQQLTYKRQVLSKLKQTISSARDRISVLNKSNPGFQISSTTVKETFEECRAIHGVSSDNKPVMVGMPDTLTSQFKANNIANNVLQSKPAFVALSSKVMSTWFNEFYQSRKNTLRSLNVYYSRADMVKAKYISIRKANRASCSPKLC